jgi:hypothetical protein
MQRCILQQKWWSINPLAQLNGIIAATKKRKIKKKFKKKKKIVQINYCHVVRC